MYIIFCSLINRFILFYEYMYIVLYITHVHRFILIFEQTDTKPNDTIIHIYIIYLDYIHKRTPYICIYVKIHILYIYVYMPIYKCNTHTHTHTHTHRWSIVRAFTTASSLSFLIFLHMQVCNCVGFYNRKFYVFCKICFYMQVCNCVGFYNRKFFVLFLFYVVLARSVVQGLGFRVQGLGFLPGQWFSCYVCACGIRFSLCLCVALGYNVRVHVALG